MSRKKKRSAGASAAKADATMAPAPARDSRPEPAGVPRGREGRLLPGSRMLHALVCASLVGLTCLLYAGDLDLGFFSLDDQTYVIDNPWIRTVSLRNVTSILTQPYFTMYAPTHLLSYLLDRALGGSDARVFHLSSNLWAGLAAALVYLVALALTAEVPVAAAAALLFVVHPVHVEAVAWISSRKDLVATLFALLSLLAHVRMRRSPQRRAVLWYVLALGFYVLAVAGKQSVVVVPAVLLAYDLLVVKRHRWAVVMDKLPYAIVTAVFALRTMGELPGTRSSPGVFTLARAFLANLWLLLGFGEQVIYRPADPVSSPGAGAVFVVLSLALVALPVLLRRRLPGSSRFLLAWLVLALLPSLAAALAARGGAGIHPVTDRYLFFASVPACVLLASWIFAVGAFLRRSRRVASVVVVLALASLWAIHTLSYLGEWRDPRSVWFAAARKSDDVNVHLYLGSHFEDAADRLSAAKALPADLVRLAEALGGAPGRGEALRSEWGAGNQARPVTEELRAELRRLAWEQFEAADRVRAARVIPNLYFRRGKMLLEQGDLAKARSEFERAYALSQEHTYADTRQSLAVQCHYALGLVDWQAKDYASALGWIRMAEEEQRRFGGHWVPEVSESRARLERIVASP